VVIFVAIPNILYSHRIETLNVLKIKAFETIGFISEKPLYVRYVILILAMLVKIVVVTGIIKHRGREIHE